MTVIRPSDDPYMLKISLGLCYYSITCLLRFQRTHNHLKRGPKRLGMLYVPQIEAVALHTQAIALGISTPNETNCTK